MPIFNILDFSIGRNVSRNLLLWLHIEKPFPISLPGRPDPGADKKAPLVMHGQAAPRRLAHICNPELHLEVGVHRVVVQVPAGPDQVLTATDLAVPRLQALKVI